MHAQQRTRRGSLLRPLAANALALLVGLVLLELVLQLGALLVGGRGPGGLPWEPGARRVLCLGDSNTYGLYLERDQAWPQQLQALWDERGSAPRLEVLNFGFPGTNSSQVRRDLPRMLASIRPHLVVVLVGVNDYWTLPVPVDEAADPRSAPRRFLQEHVRLWRLGWAVWRAWSAPEIGIPGAPAAIVDAPRGTLRYGDETFERAVREREEAAAGDETGRALRENLEAIAAGAAAGGARVLFLTYPSDVGFYAYANRRIRRAAAESARPLVDLARDFRAACPQEPCPDWLFADHHPTARGYRRLATTLLDAVKRELAP